MSDTNSMSGALLLRCLSILRKYAIGKASVPSVIQEGSAGVWIFFPAQPEPWGTLKVATLGPRSWRVTWRSNNTSSSPRTPKDSTSAEQLDPPLDTVSNSSPSPQSFSPSSSAVPIPDTLSSIDGSPNDAFEVSGFSTVPSMSSADSGTSIHGLGKEVDHFLGFDEVGKEDVGYSLLRTKVNDDV